TLDTIAGYVAETGRLNAYNQHVSEGMTATDEEIENYYKEHAEDYDSVDYYVESFLAETTSEAPTDEEIEAAMNEARDLADAAVDTLAQTGEEMTNDKYNDVEYVLADWLFDDSRKAGDTEVIEDADNNMYYAVRFTRRYLDDTPTANLRVIMSQDIDGQAVLDEWTAGEATEESFAELCNQYSADGGAVAEGGLIENVTKDSVSSDIADWVFADGRSAGDTTVITTEEGYTYVIYFVSQGDPEWKAEIADTLLSYAQTDYMDALSEKVIVEDKKGKLYYLKVQAEEEAEDSEEVSDGDAGDSGEESTEESAEDSGTESSQAQ
ncbi:MAG: peptidylprolyl isomerase, partial [Acetatifactor sp.]|nr:peptidylprolyl isomerase [Acetatifactor sp.]